MEPRIPDVIALTLLANEGKVTGKIAMQKLIYFQTKKIPTIKITEYVHYFYGPFSNKVAAALHDMSSFSLIHVDLISRHGNAYRYQLTSQGMDFAKNASKGYPDEYRAISDIVHQCKDHCDLQSTPLSYAAKFLYILEHSKSMSNEYTTKDIEKIAKNLKWKITPDDAKKGIKLLQMLSLV